MTHAELTALANAAEQAKAAYATAQETFLEEHATYKVGDVCEGERRVEQRRGPSKVVVGPMKIYARRVSASGDGTYRIVYHGRDDKNLLFHMHAYQTVA